MPDSLPTLPANAGQAREELLPSLSSCAGLEILVPKERSGIPWAGSGSAGDVSH